LCIIIFTDGRTDFNRRSIAERKLAIGEIALNSPSIKSANTLKINNKLQLTILKQLFLNFATYI
jgi:ribosomal 50S subunit-recycling heat shock protein